jgi:undecaprenyl pyrophosphate phosphatase UppP
MSQQLKVLCTNLNDEKASMDITLFLYVALQLLTESLPISSAAHVDLVLALCSRWGLHLPALHQYFDELLHGPSLVVALVYFAPVWWSSLRSTVYAGMLFCKKRASFLGGHYARFSTLIMQTFGSIVIADVLTVCFYFLLKKSGLKAMLSGYEYMMLISFAGTAAMLITSTLFPTQQIARTGVWVRLGLLLGLAQCLALSLSISRFASTFCAARACGLSPRRAFQMSWFVFVPLMVAALFLHGLPALPSSLHFVSVPLLVVVAGASVGAYGLLLCAGLLARRNQFWVLGVYMIVPLGVAALQLVW